MHRQGSSGPGRPTPWTSSAFPTTNGSWDPDTGPHMGSKCGRLGTTCMALLTLEVYYRHTPLYRRDNAGLKELERGK